MEGHGATQQRNWDLNPGYSNLRVLVFRHPGFGGTHLPQAWSTHSCLSRGQPIIGPRCWPPGGPHPLAVKLPVGITEPAEGGLVVAGEAVV